MSIYLTKSVSTSPHFSSSSNSLGSTGCSNPIRWTFHEFTIRVAVVGHFVKCGQKVLRKYIGNSPQIVQLMSMIYDLEPGLLVVRELLDNLVQGLALGRVAVLLAVHDIAAFPLVVLTTQ